MEKLINITPDQYAMIENRQDLYKDLLLKSAYITYILIKTDTQDIKNVIFVFVKLIS